MNNENPQINVQGNADIDVFAFLNLEEMVDRVIDDIFQGMILLPLQRESLSECFPGPLLSSTIEFSGVIHGRVHLLTSVGFAEKITCALTGLEPAEIEADLVTDTIGEVTNMVSGNLHTDISNTGLICELRVPKVARAEYVDVSSQTQGQCLMFRHGEHLLQVNLCLGQKELHAVGC